MGNVCEFKDNLLALHRDCRNLVGEISMNIREAEENIGKEVIYTGDDEEILEHFNKSELNILGKRHYKDGMFLLETRTRDVWVRCECLELAETQREIFVLNDKYTKEQLLRIVGEVQ